MDKAVCVSTVLNTDTLKQEELGECESENNFINQKITYSNRITNKNYNGVLPHISWNGCHQKLKKKKLNITQTKQCC